MRIRDFNDNYIEFYENENNNTYIHIVDICVKSKNQNKGFGSKLLNYLFKLYDDKYIICEVNAEKINDKIIHFFKKNGFEIIKSNIIANNYLNDNTYKKILVIIE